MNLNSHQTDIIVSNIYSKVPEEVLTVTENMSSADIQKMVVKLHLLKSAGTTDTETLGLLQVVVEKCEICAKHSRPSSKPVVGLPLATEYNETVAVDLHELEHGVWYLHIIDEFTRFSAGSITWTKASSEFVKKFLQFWICVHGSPKRLYSDNLGEFNNGEVRDMAENFNIEVKTTPAHSPWSNGLLERHDQTLTEILLKVKTENGCDWETALCWVLMAKNALHNVHGYSLCQLVFGCTLNLSSVMINKLQL